MLGRLMDLFAGSFRRQIIFTFAIGFNLLIMVFVAFLVMYEKHYLYDHSTQQTIGLAESLAVSSRSWVLADDVVGLQEVVQALKTHPDVRYGMVISSAGRVLAHTDPDKVGQYLSDSPSRNLLGGAYQTRVMVDSRALVDVAVPIRVENWKLGWARVGVGREDIARNLEAIVWRSVAFLFLAIVLSFVAAIWIAQRTGRRIFSIDEVTHLVQAGQRDVRVKVEGSDEITRLAESLNHMLDELAASEKRYRSLFDEVPVSLWEEDFSQVQVEFERLRAKGVDNLRAYFTEHPEEVTRLGKMVAIHDINRHTQELYGASSKEALLHALGEVFGPESLEAFREELIALAQGERTFNYDTTNQTLQGKIIQIHLRLSVPTECARDLSRILVSITDITERKQLETALKKLNQELGQRVEREVAENREKDHILIQQSRLAAMGEMVHNIAHQWRQPLNALSLIMANIRDDFAYRTLTEESLGNDVRKGQKLLQGMSTTIDDFRDFFRPDQEPGPFEVGLAADDALSIMEATLKNNNIEVSKNLAPGLMARGYSNQFAQVVLNILANAKEAILQHQVRPGRISIDASRRDGWAVLSIQDNALGIPAEILPKIFDPYFTTKESGSGIGLYMSKMIVEHNLKGRISAANQGPGACFEILVPLAPDEAAGAGTR
jgi:PAS domain S-box-containing protein